MSPPIRILAAALLALTAARARAELKPGDLFPPLAEFGLTDGRLPDTAGRVVLVDFWASWCAPCRASFPAYARLQSDYAARGLWIVAVSVDQDPAAFAAFRQRFQPPFVTVLDRAQLLVRAVDVPAMPTCYLLGRDRRVRFLHRGFHGGETERELHREIDRLLAEAPPSS